MAKLLLELSKPEFSKIGALTEGPNGEFTVSKRPFTFNMNELATSANVPPHVLPDPNATFESAADFFKSLATQHMLHFPTQRNDAITDEADCRKKLLLAASSAKSSSAFGSMMDRSGSIAMISARPTCLWTLKISALQQP
jgi:hypothetical protein